MVGAFAPHRIGPGGRETSSFTATLDGVAKVVCTGSFRRGLESFAARVCQKEKRLLLAFILDLVQERWIANSFAV
jgi:hypothetical protein